MLCAFGASRGTLTGMVEESADAAVGARIAEMRKQKALTQDAFLDLMEASDVSWTRTILSRIEGGQRALKAAELFVVAEALDIPVDDLNPRTNELAYVIQRQRAKLRNSVRRAREAAHTMRMHREGLTALVLLDELRSGRTTFIVKGSPVRFVYGVALAMERSEDMASVHKVIGIDDKEYKEALGRRALSSTDMLKFKSADREAARFEVDNDIYRRLLQKLYPDLKFDEGHPSLSVDDLDLGVS